jgi:hypothetical protein
MDATNTHAPGRAGLLLRKNKTYYRSVSSCETLTSYVVNGFVFSYGMRSLSGTDIKILSRPQRWWYPQRRISSSVRIRRRGRNERETHTHTHGITCTSRTINGITRVYNTRLITISWILWKTSGPRAVYGLLFFFLPPLTPADLGYKNSHINLAGRITLHLRAPGRAHTRAPHSVRTLIVYCNLPFNVSAAENVNL